MGRSRGARRPRRPASTMQSRYWAYAAGLRHPGVPKAAATLARLRLNDKACRKRAGRWTQQLLATPEYINSTGTLHRFPGRAFCTQLHPHPTVETPTDDPAMSSEKGRRACGRAERIAGHDQTRLSEQRLRAGPLSLDDIGTAGDIDATITAMCLCRWVAAPSGPEGSCSSNNARHPAVTPHDGSPSYAH